MMDSDKRLHYLSLNPVLKFTAMFSYSSSSQAIGGTNDSTHVFGLVLTADRSIPIFDLVLAAEEDEDREKAKEEEEGDAVDGVCDLLTG